MNYFRLFTILLCFFFIFSVTKAETVDELKNKIGDRNNAIQQLEQEIKKYQTDIEALSQEADSLKNNLKSLDISKKKLEADTKITENKIITKNLEIKELSLQIGDKSERITDSKRVISQSLYTISQMNSASVIETMLNKKSLSEIWNGADQLVILQGNMQNKIKDLENLKVSLESNKKQTEKKKLELVSLTNDLKNQTKIVADTVKEKNSILAETKNTEANYKQLVATKQQQKEAFEREVSELENALKIAIDPNSIPTTGAILKYPLDKVRITQYFGNTSFATKNPQIYRSGIGHNGIDFGVSIGTPVKASLSGEVLGIGNQGRCGYGKWILLKHTNGISTLYAHLSLINVTKGQIISTNEVLGYSGNTGIATGPHLHFGVYATAGIRIQTISSSCGRVLYPLADPSAYLNPLSYL